MRTPLLSVVVLIAFLFRSTELFATEQESDQVTYQGKRYIMMECPLNSLWRTPAEVPKFDIDSSSNWKSYRAAWELRGNKLFLTAFEAKQGGRTFPLTRLFPGRKLPIFASWYSGAINVPIGRLKKRDLYFNAHYGRMLIFNVERGQVQSITDARDAIYKLPP
jgi:hypothetical protein